MQELLNYLYKYHNFKGKLNILSKFHQTLDCENTQNINEKII